MKAKNSWRLYKSKAHGVTPIRVVSLTPNCAIAVFCQMHHELFVNVFISLFLVVYWTYDMNTQVSEEHNQALRILSMSLGTLSVMALTVTMSVFVMFRKTLMKDRMLIHFHLVLALLGGYVSLLLSSIYVRDSEVSWRQTFVKMKNRRCLLS